MTRLTLAIVLSCFAMTAAVQDGKSVVQVSEMAKHSTLQIIQGRLFMRIHGMYQLLSRF